MLVVTLAILALSRLVTADTGYLGSVFSGCTVGWHAHSWFKSEANRLNIANNGAYTVVYRDAQAVEAGVTCPKLTLNTPGGSYVYTYTDSSGVDQTVTGTLTWKEGDFTLENMKKGHFGTDCGLFSNQCSAKLRATYGGANGLHFMTARGFWFFCTRNSYYLVPSGTVASNCDGCSA